MKKDNKRVARRMARRVGAVAVSMAMGMGLAPVASGQQATVDVEITQQSLARELGEVVIQAGNGGDGTTEGTGSYTSTIANTATKMGLSLRETPQSVSVMTRQRMEDQGLTQLTDVVAQTPGLTVSTSGNGGSDSSPIYSRGFQVSNYMVDGIGLVNSNYSSIFQTIDMAVFDRIEVVRGATGLMNGIGEAGGAINMIRKRPARTFQASAKVEAGSWQHYRGEGDISTPLNAAGTVRGRVVAAWEKNKSYIDRFKDDKKVVYGVVEVDLGRATVASIGAMVQDHQANAHARAGRPGFDSDGNMYYWQRSDSAASDWAYSKRRTESLFVSLQHELDNGWSLKGQLSRNAVDYDELLGYATGGAVNKVTGAGVIHYASRWKSKPTQDSIDVYATGPFGLLGREHTLVIGASASQTKEDMNTYPSWIVTKIPDIFTWQGDDPEPAMPATGKLSRTEKTLSAYAAAQFKVTDALAVIGGARLTSYRISSNQVNFATQGITINDRQTRGKVTPYLGLTYALSDNWSAYASYTSIFKPQDRQSSKDVYIDPLLGNSYEVGAKGAFFADKLHVGVALFKVQQDNLAVALPTQPGGVTYYEAHSGTQTKGVEVELSGEVARNWQASASFGRSFSQDKDGKRLNYTVPQNNAKFFSTYTLPDIGHGLTLGGGVRWQSAVEQGPAQARNFKQGSYMVVDLMARYALSRQVALYANINNAFDKWYYNSLGSTYYGTPRSIRAGLDIRF